MEIEIKDVELLCKCKIKILDNGEIEIIDIIDIKDIIEVRK